MNRSAKPILSIIIPIHNVESWLGLCLDSILTDMGNAESAVEIVLFDDASSDSTCNIAQSYVDRFPEMLQLSGWSVNRGPGAARNAGMKLSKGDFCWFLDADDEIEAGMISAVLNECRSSRDLIYLGMNRLVGSREHPDPNLKEYRKFTRERGTEVLIDNESREALMMLPFAPWRMVFRRILLDDTAFPPTYYTEDLYFHLKLCLAAANILFLQDWHVLYRKRPGQLTSRNSSAIRSVNDTYRYILEDIVLPAETDMIWRVYLNRYLGKLRHLCRTRRGVFRPSFKKSVKKFWNSLPENRKSSHVHNLGPCFRLEFNSIGCGMFPEAILLCWLLRGGIETARRIFGKNRPAA